MNITLETDYAVKIVDCLASQFPKRIVASKISSLTGVTLRFSLKILAKLVSNNIVNSFRGTNGGYELATSPDLITLRQVIETVEGPFVFSRCLSQGHVCPSPSHCQKGNCKFQKTYDEISEEVRKRLDSVTFAR